MRPYLFRRFLSLAGLAGLAAGTLTTATAAAVPWAPGAAAARGAGVPAAGSQPVLVIIGTGRLPVRVSYHGRVPALPGVILTHAAGGTADGYLTAASAAAFGAALQRQFL